MPPNSDSLLRFLAEIENSFEKKEVSNDQKDNVHRFPLNNMESVYLFDFTTNKIIFQQTLRNCKKITCDFGMFINPPNVYYLSVF